VEDFQQFSSSSGLALNGAMLDSSLECLLP
jgi:hypothetical protein